MSQYKEREVPEDLEITPPKRTELMPSYTYYFSDCSSIISSVKCAVSVDDEKSRSVSPNFGTLSSSTNELNSKADYTADNSSFLMNDTSLYDPVNFKSDPVTIDDLSSNTCTFDNEDELASASVEPYVSLNLSANEEMMERFPTFGETGMGESFQKFNRWCRKYSSGNIESFRNIQKDRMKEILEENNLHIGDLKSKYFDEFPIKVLYSKGTTLNDNKFDVTSLKPGDLVVDKYVIESIIGTTTFSKVAKATELATDTSVCLKIVLPDYLEQALDEIVLLKLLNSKDDEDTKCIVRLYDSFFYSGSVFLVLELLGNNLFEATKDFYSSSFKDILKPTRPKRWNLNDLKNISYDILNALNFIHNFGIINCDLKPENVLLVESNNNSRDNKNNLSNKTKGSTNTNKSNINNSVPNGGGSNKTTNDYLMNKNKMMIKLIDFGSSCFIQDKLNTYVQSRPYRAPEVVLGLPYDTQIDMWSFGCILCELYMGRILFPSDNSATLVASMVSLLGAPPVYMLQHKMNSMFIILPNGSIADLNVPCHVLKQSPYYSKIDRSSMCCNLSASDSSKCSHVTYNKWDNATVNLEPTLDDNSSGMDDSSDYHRNLSERDLTKLNTSSLLDKQFKISNYEDNIRYQSQYQNDLDCKIKLDIRHNRNGLTKYMRIIQPYTSSIDSMLQSDQDPELALFSDFIKGLLQYDPLDRLTASAALQHPFILSRNCNSC